jgi:hypothetical protein
MCTALASLVTRSALIVLLTPSQGRLGWPITAGGKLGFAFPGLPHMLFTKLASLPHAAAAVALDPVPDDPYADLAKPTPSNSPL